MTRALLHRSHLPVVLLALLAPACGGESPPVNTPGPAGFEVVPVSDVDWGPLNPARGDASPRAADLWGDRTAEGASGFLVRFRDGFSSPPHVHNVTYRAVVLAGRVHNDDPAAEELWMGPGSFWTQPAGDVHITAARGEDVVAYVEIDEGPYLVHPVDDAFAIEEQPANVPVAAIEWTTGAIGEPEVALLWGDPLGDAGRFVRPAAGDTIGLRGRSAFHLVAVSGVSYLEGARLDPGSSVHGTELRELRCEGDQTCVVYTRTSGPLELLR